MTPQVLPDNNSNDDTHKLPYILELLAVPGCVEALKVLSTLLLPLSCNMLKYALQSQNVHILTELVELSPILSISPC